MKRPDLLFAAVVFAALSSQVRAQDMDFIQTSVVDASESPDVVIKNVVDTVPTEDKYVKIVLYSDYTWAYIDEGRPQIDTAGMFEEWDSDQIHSYKGLKAEDLPEEVDLKLVDESNPYHAPYVHKVYSGYKARRGRNHNGVDLPLDVGEPIYSAFNGVVRYVDHTGRETGGYGKLVVIRHSNGLETYYGHLSKCCVEEGEPVKAGEIIGLGGNTGRSTGPHLHFETRYMGQSFDPERLIDFETGALRDTVITLKRHYYSIYSHYGQTDAESKSAADALYVRIKKGDTLGGLAKRYGTTVNALCRMNGIKSNKILRIGEKIRVR